MNELMLNNLYASLNENSIKVGGQIKLLDLFSGKGLNTIAQLNRLSFEKKDIEFVFQKKKLPSEIDRLGRMTYNGEFKGNPMKFTLNGKLLTSHGTGILKEMQFDFTNSSLANELALLPHGVSVTIVFLDRDNPVRRLLSSSLANRTGQYHGTFTDRSQFHVDIDDPGGWGKSVLELLNENENPRVRVLQEAAQLIGDTVTHLSYEKDVESNPSRAAETIFRLMRSGEEFQPVEMRRRDVTRRPLNELVVNFQELEKHLENTRFKKYLYE
jgi:hypothetical protein